MRRTRKAGDELRLLMAMMVSQGNAARRAAPAPGDAAGAERGLLAMTDADVREIREALGRLASEEGDGAGAEASQAREAKLKTVITILEEESDEKIHHEPSQPAAAAAGGAAAQGAGKSSRLSLTFDLDAFDALALRRLQRALAIGPYAGGGAARDAQQQQRGPSPDFESRVDKSRRRAELRSLQQQTKEDEELEVV